MKRERAGEIQRINILTCKRLYDERFIVYVCDALER